MFKTIIGFMKAILELAATLVIIAGALSGETVAALFGFGNSGEIVNLLFGLLAGVSVAAILFGIPVVIININENIEKSAALLEKIERSLRPASHLANASYFPDVDPKQPSASQSANATATQRPPIPPPVTEQTDLKNCPFCVEPIRIEAIKCKHCGSELPASD